VKLKFCLLALVLLLVTSTLVTAQSPPATAAVPPTEASLGPPEHPATPEQIREYLSLIGFVENAHKVMTQMVHAARDTSASYYSASFWDDMNTAILKIDLITPNIPAYQKYFSQEDMATTIAFYKTPSGQRLLAAQPFISSSAGDVLREAGRAAGIQVALKHKDEIEALKKKSESSTDSTTTPGKSQQPN
jgi:hypothetical protein